MFGVSFAMIQKESMLFSLLLVLEVLDIDFYAIMKSESFSNYFVSNKDISLISSSVMLLPFSFI